MCIDWKNDNIVFSNYETDAVWRALAVDMLPCGMEKTRTVTRIPDYCN